MTLAFRQLLLPLLLAVLIGWQGLAVAEHKASHQHSLNTDHHCALCAMGAPAIASNDAIPSAPLVSGYMPSGYVSQSPQTSLLEPKARAPPLFSPT
ncbi:hypothetical protein [Enterovibrio sp. FF113]|uniref:hypothetical protein n=1 Tax=Enterovibrio TaxID=188143 RepID=UPI00352C42DE